MKTSLRLFTLLLFAVGSVWPLAPARSQGVSATVVSACGTPPITYVPGQSYPMTMNTNGVLCSSSTGGTTNVTVSGFTPGPAYTTPMAVTSTTSNIALPATLAVKIYNVGSKVAYVRLGTSAAVTATTANDAIQPGSWDSYVVGANTFIAAITGGTDTTTLNISGGSGLPTGSGGGTSGGAASGGLSVQDAAAFSAGVSNFTPGGGMYQASITALAPGTSGMFALGANRSLHVVDDFSSAIASATGLAGGLAVPDMTTFNFNSSNYTPIGGIFTASITPLQDGQAGVAALTNLRSLHVIDDTSASALTALQAIQTNTSNPLPTQVPTVSVGGVGIKDSAGTNTATVKAASTASVAGDLPLVVALHPTSPLPTQPNTVPIGGVGLLANIGTQSSTLTLTSATTAYTAGNLIASSATAGSVVNPTFTISNNQAVLYRARLSVNDTTSTAWGGQTVQADLWSSSPTWTNGDRAAFLPATGAAAHLGSMTCSMQSVGGDGVYGECVPTAGNFIMINAGTNTIAWSLKANTGSGVTGASKVFAFKPEFTN